MNTERMRGKRGLRTAAALAAVMMAGSVMSADVPWTYEGDDTRSGVSAETIDAAALTSYVSWTVLSSRTLRMLATEFNSHRPGFMIIVR